MSIATAPDEIVEANVRAICAVAEPHNARAGITGVLTFQAGRFAQLIEGPVSELRALMVRINADPRHQSLKIVADGPVVARRYDGWSMAYRSPRDFVRDQLSDVLDQTAAVAKAAQGVSH